MPGMPYSQPFGEFHGREEVFSDSVLAHPPTSNPKTTVSKLIKTALRTFT